MYGFLGGSAFAFFAGTVDTLTYPDLPIYTDWPSILVTWFWASLGLAGIGAIAGWFTERLKGVGVGAATLALTMLIVSITQAHFVLPMAIVVTVLILILPVTATCLPIAWALRALADRHTLALEKPDSLRLGAISLLVLVALVLGLFPATFLRTSGTAEKSLRAMHTLLTEAAAGQVDTRLGRRLEQIPAFKAHIGTPYQLKQQTSLISTAGYEIKIVYADGYQVVCTLVAYGSQKPYIYACVDGRP